MFERVSVAPADPILGLNEAFKAETRAEKINLGVGVFKDAGGNTPILDTVKEAERRLVNSETTKGYLSIEGTAAYAGAVQKLLFGAQAPLLDSGRVTTVQAPGGTGALRIGAEFLVRQLGIKTIWVSDPTWANHNGIFAAAGLTVKTYRYFDADTRGLDIDGMLADLSSAQAGEAVLLHGCCHNPTGVDPTIAQWGQIVKVLQAQDLLPFMDFAYQGFAAGVDEDAAGLRLLVEQMPEVFIASSFSKNFGLYNERVGALTAVAKTPDAATAVLSQLKSIIRAVYSNPPCHGAAVVATILTDPELTARWHEEVAAMRSRILTLRHEFVAGLKAQGVQQDFSFIAEQKGMFSFSGLSKTQVERLRDEYAIYMVGSGRINVAGMNTDRMTYLCKAIAAVL
ncbi:aspartate/tyrosine/aromatic aminotransferase [Salinispirillum sp. LH 10-3-1]|uniref:Aminotransferase n=1 Tax=Salinispirillum sp. LH 10-3-1 TaxID=2952525 RepID=A0AB38YCU5_9GAMM